MTDATPGIHHVTGIVGDAQTAVDFYAGTLGLRFCKQTVNFEDVTQHHLYFGDAAGRPGSVFTAFADPHGVAGRVGKPQVETVAFAVPEGSLDFWTDRLAAADAAVEGPETRFDERVLRFRDPAGTRVELVTGGSGDPWTDGPAGVDADPWTDGPAGEDADPWTDGPAGEDADPWTDGPVPGDVAVRALSGVSVLSVNPYATATLLEALGFEYDRETDERVRYRAPGDRATAVDIVGRETEFGREGPGTLHHVAVRVDGEDDLHAWRERVDGEGYDVSRVKDRHFFHSLYVREPGGILVELATDTGGVVSDHPTPGAALELPPFFESDRDLVESQLPELTVPDGRPPGRGTRP